MVQCFEGYTFFRTDGRPEPGHRHVNPDGSLGGWVARSAKVPESAHVDFTSKIGPDVVLQEGETISPGRFLEQVS